jgi:hypothetical protein
MTTQNITYDGTWNKLKIWPATDFDGYIDYITVE